MCVCAFMHRCYCYYYSYYYTVTHIKATSFCLINAIETQFVRV